MQMTKPLAPDSPLSAPYWEGARAGRLMLQRCAACGKTRHYPQILCNACHSAEVGWLEASRRGRVHSWSVTWHAFHPDFADALPYTLVTVDLEEGVRALARYAGSAPLRIGLPLRLCFVTDAAGTPGLLAEIAPTD